MGFARRWVSEDAFIDFRIVDNLHAGYGPVFNPGERVEAYTNPLWVALLALWRALGGRLEIGSAILGLVLSALAIVAAQSAAGTLASRVAPRRDGFLAGPRRAPLALPLGMLVFAAVPVAWDFVTSGLETGLALAWLGGVFWLVVRASGAGRRATCVAAVVVGLGPLIRPDLAIFSVAFFVALWLTGAGGRPLSRRRAVALGLAGLALPLAYQIFRMGYFAALVPNTALAKQAGAAYWAQGVSYARDFAGTYKLWVPLSLLGVWWATLVLRARIGSAAVLLVAPVIAALAHTVYVVRVGGDFMHGRLLLPTLFALLLPLATVRWPGAAGSAWRIVAAAGVVSWAVACAFALRVPYPYAIGPRGIADERGFYTRLAGPHPMSVDDYRETALVKWSRHARDVARRDRILLLDVEPEARLPLAPSVPASTRLVLSTRNIGLIGYVVGPHVHVVDRHGLSDPVASRLTLPVRGRPGHEKLLPHAWVAARFADPHAATAAYPDSSAARDALRCGDLASLLRAVEEPLTIGRFARNLWLACTLRGLQIPPDPDVARARLCTDRG